jgi:multimeric flavodoxin WrbA
VTVNILAISGSPRGKKSQTRTLAEALLTAARARGADTELIDLGEARIDFCRACEACHDKPGCVQDDDVGGILDRMLEADGIVIASPVYLDHVSAQTKALLDRSSHFVHCLRLSGKYLASVTTSGGGGGTNTNAFLKAYATLVGAQYAGFADARVPLQDADLDAARALGTALVTAIAEKQAWPEQIRAIEAHRRLFGQVMALHKDQWPYEQAYWRERGWL